MIHKRLRDITEDDLLGLVGQPEDREMDFKRELPRNDYDGVKEFLKDVSAMANTIGGDLLYGIEEGPDQNGNTVAIQVHGIAGQDADEVKLRLKNLIRDNIKPSLIGCEIQDIPLANGDRAYIVRVPRSWNSPHVVEYKGHWRFYYRSSNSSEMMDITQLRHAMIFADTIAQRLQEFRLDRLAKISADPALNSTAKIVLHFQPFDSLREDFQVDLRKATSNLNNVTLLRYENDDGNYDGFLNKGFNFDGSVISKGKFQYGYIQIFRSGAIEEVDASLLKVTSNDAKRIPSRIFEGLIIKAIMRRLGMLKDMGINSRMILHLTLLGVREYSMEIQYRGFRPGLERVQAGADQNPIGRDELLMRGILIEDLQGLELSFQKIAQIMRDTFDTIWNAAGFSKSLHYNTEGQWTDDLHE